MALTPIYGKNLGKSSQEQNGKWPSNLICSIGGSCPVKFVQMVMLDWPWPLLQHGQIRSLRHWYGKRVKHLIHAFSQMNFYTYERARSFTDLCPGYLRISFFNFSPSKTSRLMKTKLYVEPLWDGVMKVCFWDLSDMTMMATMSIYSKNPLKIFSGLKG